MLFYRLNPVDIRQKTEWLLNLISISKIILL